jgi:hypothetical protein
MRGFGVASLRSNSSSDSVQKGMHLFSFDAHFGQVMGIRFGGLAIILIVGLFS